MINHKAIMIRFRWLLSLMILLWGTNIQAQTIEAMEAFFDNDPGIGNGMAISFTNGDTVAVTKSFSISGLSAGPHTMIIRAKYDDGTWGLYTKQSFLIQNQLPGNAMSISSTEYFYDNDPGIGNGTSIPTAVGDTLKLGEDLSTIGLSEGSHTLNVRSKDQDGIWSLYANRSFYIQGNLPGNEPELSDGEYFIDSDPGVGNGSFIASGIGGGFDSVIFTTSNFQLSPGFHTLFTRIKDKDERWGLYSGRTFFVGDSTEYAPTPPLTEMEYFYNTDPGAGMGDKSPIDPNLDMIDTTMLAASTGLQDGLHQLFWRVKDGRGIWSHPAQSEFRIGECSSQFVVLTLDKVPPLCSGDVLTMSTGSTWDSYEWSTGATTSNILISQLGHYAVTVTDTLGCIHESDSFLVDFFPQLAFPNIEILGNDSLKSSVVGVSYQWFLDFNQLSFTTQAIKATVSGTYQVAVIDENGCQSDKSEPYVYTVTDVGDEIDDFAISLFPNPTSGLVELNIQSGGRENVELNLVNSLGQIINIYSLQAPIQKSLQLNSLSNGIYWMNWRTENHQGSIPIMIRR